MADRGGRFDVAEDVLAQVQRCQQVVGRIDRAVLGDHAPDIRLAPLFIEGDDGLARGGRSQGLPSASRSGMARVVPITSEREPAIRY
jgi:hypothetical protein